MRAIDVRDLLDQPGSARTAPIHEAVEGLRTELAAVPDDTPIDGDLRLENVVEGILVSGRLAGRMTFTCARCLKGFESGFEVELSELFAREPDPDADVYELPADGTIDPEPMVRDAVVLSMPFSPLCKPGCRGLCERCGGDRNLGECRCPPAMTDPRWAGLEGASHLFE
ncbi:MAG TPA: DUF177 domain-containing protein [Actinomycetota bacterium]|nr:DUF177 domain-containing protein [Actinomycetota bacterium]